jgi:arylsulfatase A-like enzyme
MKYKNILFILPDQFRADCLGYKGIHPHLKTPHLDRLASGGVSFDTAVTPAPLCGPARCSVFSGLYPHQARGILEEEKLGARDEMEVGVERDMLINTTELQERPLLTDLLRERGYHMAYAGKWHLGENILGNWFPQHHGSINSDYVTWLQNSGLPREGWALNDHEVKSQRVPHMSIPHTKVSAVDEHDHNDAWVTDIALQYLRDRPKDQPLFLVCGLNGPHPPLVVPQPYYGMYDPGQMEKPGNFGPIPGELDGKKNSFYRRLFEDHGEDWDVWRKSVAVYHGYCSYIDAQVGRLLAGLEEEGILDETLVVFASDHGEMLGQRGLWHKMQAYEESLRVPLIISAPWIRQGERSRALASLIDIAPTLLDLAGAGVPLEYEGESLLPLLDGRRDKTEREYVYAEQEPLGPFHGESDWRMVSDGRWKYVWNYGDKDELYDLEADPWEVDNLAEDVAHGAVLDRLKTNLAEWMVRTNDKFTIEKC